MPACRRFLATLAACAAASAMGAPVFGTSPNPASFGNVDINGAPATMNYGFFNSGADVTVTEIRIVGPDAADFQKSFDCDSFFDPVGTGCNFFIHFDPSTIGPRTATLEIVTDDGIFSDTLTGTGAIAGGTLAPSPLAFGDVALGLSATLPLTLTADLGPTSSALAVGAITFGGTDAAEFSQTNDCTVLQPGESCTIQVTFAPLAVTGPRTANVSVASNADVAIAPADLTGNAVPADQLPDAFTFTAVTGVVRSTVRTSNTVTITGINVATPISVVAGEYSIGCTGTFTSADGSIANGQTVCVRHVSSASFRTLPGTGMVTTDLKIGLPGNIVTGSFSSTTLQGFTLTVAMPGTGSGTVTGTGIACPGDCTEVVASGTVVTLTKTTNVGSIFGGWSGAGCTGTAGCTVTVNADKTATATFTLIPYTVTPSAGAHGTITPATPQTVGHGLTRVFTVTPNAGYTAHVSSTCGGALVGTQFTTDPIVGNCTVAATFLANQLIVTPTPGNGGTMSPSTPQTVNRNATTQFTITTNAGFAFLSAGGTCGGTLAGNVYTTAAITDDCTVTATFVSPVTYFMTLEGWQRSPYLVTSAFGSGTATFNPLSKQLALNLNFLGLTGTETVAHIHGPGARGANADILFTLVPGSPKTDVVTLNAAQEAMLNAGELYVDIHSSAFPTGEIRAQFDSAGAVAKAAMTVVTTGAGTGSVQGTTEAGTVINCGSDCTETIPIGKTLTLTAVPSGGSTFVGWSSGYCTGKGSCQVTMSGAGYEMATFDPPASSTSADVSVALTVDRNPVGVGKDIVLTATATNHGPAAAKSVRMLIDFVAPGTTLVWVGPGCTNASGSADCRINTSLAAGASFTGRMVVRPSSIATFGASAVAQAYSQLTPDPDSANDVVVTQVTVDTPPPGTPIQRYRLYSDVTKEHHFTTDLNEYNVLGTYVGTWVQEGTVGKILNNPGPFGGVESIPYYRLYDTNTRWHHWTTDANEYYTLGFVYSGWNMEGVDGWILPTNVAGTTQLYRLNYPALGALHHWTIDANEYNTLITSFGWVGEPGAGFVVQ